MTIKVDKLLGKVREKDAAIDGVDGEDGVGIVSVIKTGTVGLVDTYTITYSDDTTSTFDVTNGEDGAGSGDVMGPATNTNDYIPQWDGANSKTLKDGLAVPAGGLAGLTAMNKALAQSKSFIITNPTASSDLPLWRVPVGITITSVSLLCKGNVVVGQLWQFDANGLNGATVDGSDITGVVDTNVNDDGTLSAATITANNYIGWKTTSVTGTPTYAIISFTYIIN